MQQFHNQVSPINMSKILQLQAGTLYDYVFDKAECKWMGWMDTVQPQAIPADAAFHEIIVQTIDTVRYTYLLDLLITHGRHVLFTGITV